MSSAPSRWPAAIALVASTLGLAFSALSTSDYIQHLDRQIHDVHCSFIPGVTGSGSGENPCRVAMYSPYSALFRDSFWGGIPISLFAVGAFVFFIAFALYMLFAGRNLPRRASHFLFAAGITPLGVSILMAIISAVKLGSFCKTCVGIYVSSILLAIAGIGALISDLQHNKTAAPPQGYLPSESTAPPAPRMGGMLLLPSWFVVLGAFALAPAALYAGTAPSYASYINNCGKLEKTTEPNNALLRISPAGARQSAFLFVDPLCPTCKGFHQRLVAEGIFEQLDTTLVLFPLDSECNWMLDRPVHPGACTIAKAILCNETKALATLEWAYENQETILSAAKSSGGDSAVRNLIRQRFTGLDTCIDAKDTSLRLSRMLRFIVNNHLPVSTPQMFLGDTRVCDEDTDLGLPYTIRRLAPNLKF